MRAYEALLSGLDDESTAVRSISTSVLLAHAGIGALATRARRAHARGSGQGAPRLAGGAAEDIVAANPAACVRLLRELQRAGGAVGPVAERLARVLGVDRAALRALARDLPGSAKRGLLAALRGPDSERVAIFPDEDDNHAIVMLFEGREIPDQSGLAPLLRAEALRPTDMPRGDEGDHRPLHRVRRLLAAHPEITPRVTDAYLRLLRDPDPRVFVEMLEHLAACPVYVVPPLYELIAERGNKLRWLREPGRTDGRSLLGTLVDTLRNMVHRGPPPGEAARLLAELQNPEDGWPTSLLLALPADLPGLVPRLLATLQALDDHQLARFARGMALYGPPLTDQGLEAIGRGPAPLRDRFAAALRDFFCEPEDAPRLGVLLHRLGIEDE